MNTFHIRPNSPLARAALEQVKAFPAETLVAIRGATIVHGDESREDHVHTVCECPDPDNHDGYVWAYVRADEWLAQYDAHWAPFEQFWSQAPARSAAMQFA